MNRLAKAATQILHSYLLILVLVLAIPGARVYGQDLPPPIGASNTCVPGQYDVGKVDYNFEDAIDLNRTGSTTPEYPKVDVRATVRYPARSSGVSQPVAGDQRYPLIVFLHGNHNVCPPSPTCKVCTHSCPASDRIPNHLGYNYLLDLLASRGFIVVSIDGFDVTCLESSSYEMTEYEARGRLVLHHLQRWQEWDNNGNDPWGGLFRQRVDLTRIGLSGHSRGGEGVLAAEFFNRAERHGFHIKAVNTIAPTDRNWEVHYVPQVPYFLLLNANDGDLPDLEGLQTYDRTSLQGAVVQSDKMMLWVHGANHNYYNTVWTPGSGFACAWDDAHGIGEGRLSAPLQQKVACQTLVPFFELYLQDKMFHKRLFQGEQGVQGLDAVTMYWTFQHPERREVDNFDSGDDPKINSLGGTVMTSGGFVTVDEFEFKPYGKDRFNDSFRHFTHGLVLQWNKPQTYETSLPPAQRDISGYQYLVLRGTQIMDTTWNPSNTPRTFRVTLRTASGTLSSQEFPMERISYPYPYKSDKDPTDGPKTVLSMVRIPLSTFRNGSSSLPLSEVEAVIFDFSGTGLIAIDDIQFSK